MNNKKKKNEKQKQKTFGS